MAIFIVLLPYLLTTKLRCLQKNNIGHTIKGTQQNHDISVHEEEKFHKCLSCNVSFDSIYLLNDHNKSVHDEIHLEKIVEKKPKILKEFVSKHTFDKNEDSVLFSDVL